MHVTDRIKTARMLAALAKPLIARLGGAARTGGELLRDFRPGSRAIAPLERWAAGAGRRVNAADAYKATLGKWGQRALGAGQFATGIAPGVGMIGAVASGTITPWAMPVWNTAMNAGRGAGQMFGWRNPEQTRQWVEQGANDTMLGVHGYLNQLGMGDRMQALSQMHAGQWLDPGRAADMSAGRQPQGPGIGNFLPGIWSPNAVGRSGDMSNWLMQQALQRQQAMMMNKSASAMTKAARARAIMGMLRGAGQGLGRIFGRQQVPFLPRPAVQVPFRPASTGQLAGKWGWRGTKALGTAAALPAGVGFAGGYFNSDLDAQQVGSDMALAKLQEGMQQTGGLKRFAVAADPSLLLQQAGQVSPGLFNRYRQVYGQDFQPGFLGQIQQWAGNLGQELKNPTFLAADSSGIRNIPTT